jgi:DNA-binding NarL/FixJ family response regulator
VAACNPKVDRLIRVLLAEDQTIVRRGIVTLLGLTPDIRVVAEAADGAEALALSQPDAGWMLDIAILDIRMPKLSGIEVIEQWKKSGRDIPAILLTTFDEDPLFLEAVRAGAKGFLLKDISLERLAEAIRIVAAGKTLLQPAVTERVIRIVKETGTLFESTENPDKLTPRECDVLRLVAAGYSNREIGESLKISEGAVKNHLSVVLSKLGARDRTRAVLRGIQLGILE